MARMMEISRPRVTTTRMREPMMLRLATRTINPRISPITYFSSWSAAKRLWLSVCQSRT